MRHDPPPVPMEAGIRRRPLSGRRARSSKPSDHRGTGIPRHTPVAMPRRARNVHRAALSSRSGRPVTLPERGHFSRPPALSADPGEMSEETIRLLSLENDLRIHDDTIAPRSALAHLARCKGSEAKSKLLLFEIVQINRSPVPILQLPSLCDQTPSCCKPPMRQP